MHAAVSCLQEKVEVNGPGTHPVWKYLKSACPTCDGDVTWNFKVGCTLNQ
jgi:glutathione peroxidase-family protein